MSERRDLVGRLLAGETVGEPMGVDERGNPYTEQPSDDDRYVVRVTWVEMVSFPGKRVPILDYRESSDEEV